MVLGGEQSLVGARHLLVLGFSLYAPDYCIRTRPIMNARVMDFLLLGRAVQAVYAPAKNAGGIHDRFRLYPCEI